MKRCLPILMASILFLAGCGSESKPGKKTEKPTTETTTEIVDERVILHEDDDVVEIPPLEVEPTVKPE